MEKVATNEREAQEAAIKDEREAQEVAIKEILATKNWARVAIHLIFFIFFEKFLFPHIYI